ncbi:hypothetical protein AVEN_187971-1 [Araneus ventricosus]|uniref:Uncharacterized protein n=1 Tax=Araneus ventricosus TaxID=182803 RepID=A0A4Y2PE68_ARAVE|nr:hypothetical protein AVEN_187971-1 [Araneus ventricosus]
MLPGQCQTLKEDNCSLIMEKIKDKKEVSAVAVVIMEEGKMEYNDQIPLWFKLREKKKVVSPLVQRFQQWEDTKGSIPTVEASVKTKKKSKGGQKKKKSTSESSLKIKIPEKQEPIEDLTEKLEAGAQSADSARPHDGTGTS